MSKKRNRKNKNHKKEYRVMDKPKKNNKRRAPRREKIVEIPEDKMLLVGTFQRSQNFGFVVPNDKAIKTDIFISKKKFNKARNNDKVIVQITKLPQDGRKAEGEIVEVIGNMNIAGIDMLCIEKLFGLIEEFPLEVLSEAKSIGQEVSDEAIEGRKDFRGQNIFTIDGEDAKDLDDAIHIEKLENGNYKLDVHIADVSNYVQEGSFLDKEAIRRGTSVYMLDRVIPMLPVELSNGICSLNAGKNRLALSCLMEINPNGDVIDSEICKSVIKVTERMTYTNVYKIITNSDDEVIKRYEPYVNDFKLMEELAHILKEKRVNKGYLNLDIPEPKLVLDEEGKCIDVKKYELNFANEIIEQFMLTANETVAETFYKKKIPFIYRVHEEPDYDKIMETNHTLGSFGYHINAKEDKISPLAFAEVLEKSKDTDYEKIVSTLVLRTLKLADYRNENCGHFGIASKYYCHFTSPIRRYPDLFIHRVISYYLSGELDDKKKSKLDKKAFKYAESSSACEQNAVKAEREAEKIKKAEYMQQHLNEEFEGIVSSVTSFGMFVELDNTVEGLVRFESMGDEYFEYDDTLKQLIGEHTNKVFKIGDKVKVRCILANKDAGRIDFELVDN